MKKYKKQRFLVFIMIFAILINLLTLTLTVSATASPVYLSLGDSIASGYALTSKDDGYAYLLSKNRYELADFAVPGYDTSDLLKQLSDTSNSALQSAVSNASLITVSIGGNNFLKPLMSIAQTMNIEDIAANLPDDIKNNPNLTNPSNPSNSTNSTNPMDSIDVGSLMSLVTVLNKYFTPGTNEYAEFTKALDAGTEQFESDLDKILAIFSKNKNAKIVFLTVYNPYKDFGLSYIKGLDTMTELYIGKINKIITDKSNSNQKYTVADIHSAFQNSALKVSNADVASMNMDVHPNVAGHKLIYKIIAHSIGVSIYFDDMGGDAWAVEYVDDLFDRNIMFGTNTQNREFSPKSELKNCDLAVLLVRTLKLKIEDSDVADVNLPFSDADKIESYAFNSVKACYKAGLYSDLYPAGKTYEFGPQNAAKRIDVALMVVQLIDKSRWSNKKPVYSDLNGVSEAYYPALSTLYEYGIMTGSPDKTLNPFGGLTRAQVAKILYSILNSKQ